MQIEKLVLNQQLYGMIFLIDNAIQSLFSWILDYNISVPEYDKLKNFLNSKIKSTNKNMTVKDRKWLSSFLKEFLKNCTNKELSQGISARHFVNNKDIAMEIYVYLKDVISCRNDVMHGRIANADLHSMAEKCHAVLEQLRLFSNASIETAGQLQLLTLTKMELLTIVGGEWHKHSRKTINVRGQEISFLRTWYPGYWNPTDGIGEHLLGHLVWPESNHDIPKYVSEKPLTMKQVTSIMNCTKSSGICKDNKNPEDEEVLKISTLTDKAKRILFDEISTKLYEKLSLNAKIEWALYRPHLLSYRDVWNRYCWPRNTEGLAYIAFWPDYQIEGNMV